MQLGLAGNVTRTESDCGGEITQTGGVTNCGSQSTPVRRQTIGLGLGFLFDL